MGKKYTSAFISSIFLIAWFACALLWFPSLWGFLIPGVLGGVGAFFHEVRIHLSKSDIPLPGFISGALFTVVVVISIFFWIWTPLLSSFLLAVCVALAVYALE